MKKEDLLNEDFLKQIKFLDASGRVIMMGAILFRSKGAGKEYYFA